MKKIINLLVDAICRAMAWIWSKCGHSFGDETYLKVRYFLLMRKKLNLDKPRIYSEKLQWLKLYNRKPEYTTIVDKYAVKDYVANKIGGEYIIPTLGVWDSPKDVDFSVLPDQFVLKTTHGGGGLGVVICKDKKGFDKETAIRTLEKNMKTDWKIQLEWPYKDVPHRIIAEKYIEPDPITKDLPDYKFSCFDGEVTDVMVCIGRSTGNTKFYFFNKEWELLPLNKLGKQAPKGFTLPKPSCMDEMFDMASKLSKGLPYARVDLYAVGDKPYFGEITFYPQSGFDRNLLPETELFYGEKINLPQKTN